MNHIDCRTRPRRVQKAQAHGFLSVAWERNPNQWVGRSWRAVRQILPCCAVQCRLYQSIYKSDVIGNQVGTLRLCNRFLMLVELRSEQRSVTASLLQHPTVASGTGRSNRLRGSSQAITTRARSTLPRTDAVTVRNGH